MSDKQDIESTLASLGEELSPPPNWERQVWRRMREPSLGSLLGGRGRRRPRWYFALPLIGVVAAMWLVFMPQSKVEPAVLAKADNSSVQVEEQIAFLQAEVSILQERLDRAFTAIAEAATDASREAAMVEAKRARAALKRARDAKERATGIARAKKAQKAIKKRDKCAKSDDPLCGL